MSRVSLRSRLLLALLATSAATLAAAALALLSPLQERLREQARDSLRAAALTTRPQLEDALRRDKSAVGIGYEVADLMNAFETRTGARAVLYATRPSVLQRHDTDVGPIREDDVYHVYNEVRPRTLDSSTDEGARLAVPLYPKRQGLWILAVRKSDVETTRAVREVRKAFLVAAGVGLGVALLLGLALSATITRRLGRLRRAALRMARDGPDAPAPHDDGADEVGDLARALASMQGALRRQEAARRAFVATASHELRTPLTSLQGNLELLAEDLDEGRVDLADAREQLRSGQVELRRLGNLASELLDLSRLDAGVTLRFEPVELGELCRAVAAEFDLRARERAVDIAVVPPPGPVWAGGDPGAVARVVRILLDNALRFSPAGDAVQVAAAYHGERATIEVADRGPGVPDEEREAIFERFRRGSRTGGEGGFGLGLAIGRELARRLDGELTLAQDAGPGARFVLTLPIHLPRDSSERVSQPLEDTHAS